MKFINKILISLLMSGLSLTIFAFVYLYEGVHINNHGNGTDYKWESKQLRTKMTEGFAWFFLDKNGFNNINTYDKKNIDILLMGSSHMEAMQVNKTSNTGALLNSYLFNKFVYNIGTSGHTLYRCVDNIHYAINTYKPKDYIIIETSAVKLNIKDMTEIISDNGKPIPSYDSGIIYYLQKNPALKLLQSQTENWINSEKKTDNNDSNIKIDFNKYKSVLKQFLDLASKECKNNKCKLIIFFQPNTTIKENGEINFDTPKEYIKVFSDICKEENIIFIDMTEDFERNYKEKHILPHGFINTSFDKGHLNKYGHKMIAEKLAGTIKELEESK